MDSSAVRICDARTVKVFPGAIRPIIGIMSSPEVIDAIVIGAGVVGLAIGRSLAGSGRDTLIIERNRNVGEETSSRNSGVIHSGIYYPAHSLKARLCVRGRKQLYDYCGARGIAHRRCGKLIVAGGHQVEALDALQSKGVENGLSDLQWLGNDDARGVEPEVRCEAALYSPSTGIVDVHELMVALLGDFEALGGTVVLETEAIGIRPVRDGLELTLRNGRDRQVIIAGQLVNSAGLAAVDLVRRIDGYPTDQIPTAFFAKGNYFSCSSRPFRHLVYPMPNDAGLGIHATLDFDGSVRFGPDVEWVTSIDCRIDSNRAAAFYDAIREYWPGIADGQLYPAYAGIRPKIVGPGQKAADFLITGPADHGIPGLVNLLGIESPGLTASLAIADYVRAILDGLSAD